jgi:hypothetical protein
MKIGTRVVINNKECKLPVFGKIGHVVASRLVHIDGKAAFMCKVKFKKPMVMQGVIVDSAWIVEKDLIEAPAMDLPKAKEWEYMV